MGGAESTHSAVSGGSCGLRAGCATLHLRSVGDATPYSSYLGDQLALGTYGFSDGFRRLIRSAGKDSFSHVANSNRGVQRIASGKFLLYTQMVGGPAHPVSRL